LAVLGEHAPEGSADCCSKCTARFRRPQQSEKTGLHLLNCGCDCPTPCQPVVPAALPGNVTCAERSSPEPFKLPKVNPRSQAAVALSQVLTHLQDCPAPQPCDCWCHCKELLFGEPMPPGIPPVPAVNPYQPPPPLPPPPPPPFFGAPPPAGGVPFNPSAPAFFQRGLRRSLSSPGYPSIPYGPSGCPETSPCNCYCACRPEVPPKR
jgi:hypothetical protein